ncbi:MAG TPA: hypothetical protein VH723_05410 [Candidatus Limnocylindrales bacterium]|jgi:hypothetical protein
MFKLWSEVPSQQIRELTADLLTVIWVGFWSLLAWNLYTFLAQFAEAGRILQTGGRNIADAGVQLGDAVRGAPLIGEGAADIAVNAFASAGEPFRFVGSELEQLLLVIAALLGLLVVAVALVPWLTRYLPWRIARLRRLRAAHAAIRTRPKVSDEAIARILAARAVSNLSYEELLHHSDDPLGDLASGRYERLVRAEMEASGLRPRRLRPT